MFVEISRTDVQRDRHLFECLVLSAECLSMPTDRRLEHMGSRRFFLSPIWKWDVLSSLDQLVIIDLYALREWSENSLNRPRHQLWCGLQFKIVQSRTISDLGAADSSMCETISYVNDCVLLIEIIHQSSHFCLRLKDMTISLNKSYCPRGRFRFH